MLFLASDAASHITVTEVGTDGGESLREGSGQILGRHASCRNRSIGSAPAPKAGPTRPGLPGIAQPERRVVMDGRDMREWMGTYLGGVDWSRGVTKADLLDRVGEDEALRNLIGQYVAEGTYFSTDDVLTVIPEQAWQDAQGGTWRGGETPDEPLTQTNFPASPVAQAAGLNEGQGTSAPADGQAQGSGPADAVRQTVGQAAQQVSHAAAKVADQAQGVAEQVKDVAGLARGMAEQARERAGTVAQGTPSVSALTDRVKQTASQARDQVLSVTTKADAAPSPQSAAAADPKRRAVAVGLSAVAEGFGQAYNRQPAKALPFFVVGITLSTVSGLNTWIARHVFRARNATLGTDQVRPALVGLWAATFGLNLWDAWKNARGGGSQADHAASAGSNPPATWADLDPARSAAPSPSTATDEYPTVAPTG